MKIHAYKYGYKGHETYEVLYHSTIVSKVFSFSLHYILLAISRTKNNLMGYVTIKLCVLL